MIIICQIWWEELWCDPLRGWSPPVCGRGAVCGHQSRVWRRQRSVLRRASRMWRPSKALSSKLDWPDWILYLLCTLILLSPLTSSRKPELDINLRITIIGKSQLRKKKSKMHKIDLLLRRIFYVFECSTKVWHIEIYQGSFQNWKMLTQTFLLRGYVSLLDIYARYILKCWNFLSLFKVDLCQPENMWHFKG